MVKIQERNAGEKHTTHNMDWNTTQSRREERERKAVQVIHHVLMMYGSPPGLRVLVLQPFFSLNNYVRLTGMCFLSFRFSLTNGHPSL